MKNIFLDGKFVNRLVVLNTIAIFVAGFEQQDVIFGYIDDVFTLLFLIEAVVKIRTWSWKGYWSNGWNRFDFIILLFALPSLTNILDIIPGTSLSTFPTNVLLALRVFRSLKVIRTLKYVPHIENIMRGFKVAIRSSIVVCFAYIVFLLVVSILTTTIFGTISPEAFGNPGISLYSMFRLFTIEGWYDLPDQIASNSSVAMGVFARIYFSVFLFAGGIIGMSLINSIFVDAMAQDNNDDVKKDLNDIKEQLEKIEKSLNYKK